MKYMTINNRKVAFDDEKNVLSVIRKAGINLPTFCYHSELSTYGACRMCVVEDDRGKIFASCSEVPRDGMVIYTNTPKLQHHRKMILELMLSAQRVKKMETARYRILPSSLVSATFALKIINRRFRLMKALTVSLLIKINVFSAEIV